MRWEKSLWGTAHTCIRIWEFLGEGLRVPFSHCYVLLTPTLKTCLQLGFVPYENTKSRIVMAKFYYSTCCGKLFTETSEYSSKSYFTIPRGLPACYSFCLATIFAREFIGGYCASIRHSLARFGISGCYHSHPCFPLVLRAPKALHADFLRIKYPENP